MKKGVRWTEMGQFLASLLSLFTIIRETCQKSLVDLEIIPWLIGSGKEFFTESFLTPLCEKFIKWKKIAPHIIDCNAYPSIPDGYEVYYHCKQGKMTWDPAKPCPLTFLSPDRRWEGEEEVTKELKNRGAANACFLDYILENKDRMPFELITDGEKGVVAYFGGTIYKNKCNGSNYIRAFVMDSDGGVSEFMQWIDYTIHMNRLVALIKK